MLNFEEETFFDTLSFSNTTWRYRIALVPHICAATDKIIWPFTKAVRGIRRIDDDFLIDKAQTYWITPKEYVFRKLQKKL